MADKIGSLDFIFQREEPDGSPKYVIVEVKADNQIEDAVVQWARRSILTSARAGCRLKIDQGVRPTLPVFWASAPTQKACL
ncbi:MAG: hypothetical protein KGJ74_13795 [Betaproteobacteria bacterium]|nr:hypothetical protein [Betaproteobacteria bacterium]